MGGVDEDEVGLAIAFALASPALPGDRVVQGPMSGEAIDRLRGPDLGCRVVGGRGPGNHIRQTPSLLGSTGIHHRPTNPRKQRFDQALSSKASSPRLARLPRGALRRFQTVIFSGA